jgi:uncharacterized protein with HEPN domain
MSSGQRRFFIDDIVKAIKNLQGYVKEISFEEFFQNDILLAAVERKFIVIGEIVRHVPGHIRERYPSIPWRKTADMRNLVTHFYWRVEPRILWSTIKQDLPPLIPLLEKVLEESSD